MTQQLCVSPGTLQGALHQLRDEGLLVKRLVERPSGKRVAWVPTARAPAFAAHLGIDELAALIARRAARERWTMLPSQPRLAELMSISERNAIDATKVLARRGVVHKLLIGGRWRWCLLPPHKLRSIDPRATVADHKVVVCELLRRIRDGEFRYRTPDGVIHEQPFLARVDLMALFKVSGVTIDKARSTLTELGWIEPDPNTTALYRLADTVAPADRATHPARLISRKRPLRGTRVPQIVDDLIERIRAGEFTDLPQGRLSYWELRGHYRTGDATLRGVLDELHRRGWIVFRHERQQRRAHLANPQPTETGALHRRPAL